MASRGTVKFYDHQRGFGFIVPAKAGEKEIYFNRASLPLNRAYDPVQGDEVQYEARPAAKGMMAVRIQQVSP